MKKYFLRKNCCFALLLTVFMLFAGRCFADDMDEAFAGFLKGLYVNSKTVYGGNKLCFYGRDGVSVALADKVGRKNTVFVEDGSNCSKCRIIYIARSKERFAKSFVSNSVQDGVLTVALFPDFVKDGGMMIVEPGRRNFEVIVNNVGLRASGVVLDSSIADLIVERR